MKKKKYIEKFNRKLFVIVGLVTVALILIFVILLPKIFVYYKIENRVDNYNKYKKNDNKNYKTVGWLRVQGTNIDYPVLYAPNYNLSNKTDDFLWTEVDDKSLPKRVSVVGHNILNLSNKPLTAHKNHRRFEQLMSFVYQDFVEDNKYIQYTFEGKNYLYKIYAVYFTDEYGMELYNDYNDKDSDLNKYIKNNISNSIYDFDVDVDTDDKFISLFTCTKLFGTNDKADFRIDARMVRDGENVKNYRVSTNENYEAVEMIMKGGGENEKA